MNVTIINLIKILRFVFLYLNLFYEHVKSYYEIHKFAILRTRMKICHFHTSEASSTKSIMCGSIGPYTKKLFADEKINCFFNTDFFL